jgi:mono/diheme cytochrome c family protein
MSSFSKGGPTRGHPFFLLPGLSGLGFAFVWPILIFAVSGSLLTGCFSEDAKHPDRPPAPSADRGRVIYQTQCIACHNADPHKPGSIGPDVYGSSKELLRARILNAAYPPGYKPKRETHAMAKLPHLKNEIDSVYEFLNPRF